MQDIAVKWICELTDSERKQLLDRGGIPEKHWHDALRVMSDIKVHDEGARDSRVNHYAKEFRDIEEDLDDFRVTDEEYAEAIGYEKLNPQFVSALRQSAANIKKFHADQLTSFNRSPDWISVDKGIVATRRWVPIETVGLHVPTGNAPLTSTVLMLGIPALLAGVKQIVICAPPRRDGTSWPQVIAAVRLLQENYKSDEGQSIQVFKVGGVQAVAAMSFGTGTIPRVNKIFGPGNLWVQAAKVLAVGMGPTPIDIFAGPSELLIIADDSADKRLIASDLLSAAEHGDDSAAILLTTSAELANSISDEVNRQIRDSIEKQPDELWVGGKRDKEKHISDVRNALRTRGLIGLVDSLDEAVSFANSYGPEHIEIVAGEANALSEKIENTGSVFLGPYTPKSAGDYVIGTNHTLPTGGSARGSGALSIESFGRFLQVQEVSLEGLDSISETIRNIGVSEFLPAHSLSPSSRFSTGT